MKRPVEKVLRPVHPNAGIEAEYRQRIDAMIDAMSDDYERRIRATYRRNTPEIAQDAKPKRVTAIETQLGGPDKWWHAYVDGVMLRKKNGVGRSFRSQEAAELAGLRTAGPDAVLTEGLKMADWERLKTTPFEFLQNARPIPTPATALNDSLGDLGAKWTARFDEAAPKLARWFAQSSSRQSQAVLKKILRDAGVSVKFQLTPTVRDIFDATVAENVGLIKSIASQYHTEVQGMVMRSVTSGRDLASLTDDLEKRFRITRNRAKFIALDQNNKATAVITRARQKEVGIEEAIWLHSHGGKEPRKTHLANSGKRYKVSEGWYDPDPRVRRHIFPGELINCRCVSRPIVKGFS